MSYYVLMFLCIFQVNADYYICIHLQYRITYHTIDLAMRDTDPMHATHLYIYRKS